MFEVYKCDQCKNRIKIKAMRGFTHVTCEKCEENYELTQKSLKYYMLLPFIAVAISVLLSINFIVTNDIFIKAAFILSVSYILFLLMGMTLVKWKFLKYEKEQEDQNGRKNEKI